MATWIKFVAEGQRMPVLIDMDKVFAFFEDARNERITLHIGNLHLYLVHKYQPDVYTKVLDYMRQIELQIK